LLLVTATLAAGCRWRTKAPDEDEEELEPTPVAVVPAGVDAAPDPVLAGPPAGQRAQAAQHTAAVPLGAAPGSPTPPATDEAAAEHHPEQAALKKGEAPPPGKAKPGSDAGTGGKGGKAPPGKGAAAASGRADGGASAGGEDGVGGAGSKKSALSMKPLPPSPINVGPGQLTFRTTVTDRFVEQGGTALAGTVLDADTRAPVATAKIEIWMGTKSMHGETDAAGRFRLEGLVPGSRVTLWITASPGYVQEHRELSIPSSRPLMETQVRLLPRGSGHPDAGGGVGMFLGHRGGRTVITGVTAFGPAERAGVVVGDAIVAIDGRAVSDLGPGAIDQLLRGSIGEEVELSVTSPGGKPRKVTLRRVAR
jgi:hypothetical protein